MKKKMKKAIDSMCLEYFMNIDRKIILICLLLTTLAAIPFIAAADFELARWGFAREILPATDAQNSDFALIELDGAVYQNAQSLLYDLRVIDDQNKETAAMIIAPKAENEARITAKIINRQITNGNSVYTVDCGKDQNYNGIDIATLSKNFSRRVKIEGSTDGVWHLLRGDGYVMDFSRDEQKQVSQIRFDSATFRYLRVTIFEQKETPITVTNISLLPAQKDAAPYVELPAEILSQTEDKIMRASVLTLKLSHLKMQSSRLELLIDGTNFSRHVTIESSNDAPEKNDGRWFRTGTGEVHDLAIDAVKLHNLTIDYPATRAGFLRIKVFNHDDQPLRIRGAKVFAQPWYLLFKREAGRSYRLFYGNEKAVAPQYDLAQLAAYVKTANLPRLKLGPETKLTPSAEPTNANRNSILIGVAVVIAVAVLGSLIYRLARSSTN